MQTECLLLCVSVAQTAVSGQPSSTDLQSGTVTKDYRNMRCTAFGLGRGATKEHSCPCSVTDEQRRPKPNVAPPSGRQSFFALTSLLVPHRPLTGMLVACALSA